MFDEFGNQVLPRCWDWKFVLLTFLCLLSSTFFSSLSLSFTLGAPVAGPPRPRDGRNPTSSKTESNTQNSEPRDPEAPEIQLENLKQHGTSTIKHIRKQPLGPEATESHKLKKLKENAKTQHSMKHTETEEKITLHAGAPQKIREEKGLA